MFYLVSFKLTVNCRRLKKCQLFFGGDPRISFEQFAVGRFLFLFVFSSSQPHAKATRVPVLCRDESLSTEVDMKSIDSLREMKDKLQTALKAWHRNADHQSWVAYHVN